MKVKLKSVRLCTGVPFTSALDSSLNYADAVELVYDDQAQLIRGVPKKRVGSAVKAVCIPLSNVIYFEELDEVAVEVLAAKKKAEAAKPPEPVKAPVDDTIKLVPNRR